MNIHSLYGPFLRYFRRRRMQDFVRRFGITETTRVLDVGGSALNWSLSPVVPRLTVANLYRPSDPGDDRFPWVLADGRRLPFRDGAFDVAYCNSVIEHLGNRENQRAFAREISRVGVSYYVQTPNRWFPVEPHLLTPFIHFFPRKWRERLIPNFTLWGWVTRPTPAQSRRFVAEVELLDRRQVGTLFPDAELILERAAGLAKSIVAVRNRR